MTNPQSSDAMTLNSLFRLLLVCVVFSLVGACASTPGTQTNQDDQNQEHQANATSPDKFEGFNRAIFKFNDTMDRWLLKPVAKGYAKILPKPVKSGVGNFFDNLGEVTNVINDGLQWKWKQAAHDSGRFLINSTVGVLGLFDVASKTGLEKSDGETFTQTLAVWGVPRGSYLVLPFLGPTTIRGGFATPVDWYTSPITYIDVDPQEAQWGLVALDFIHDRAELLKTEELISGDRYLFVREVYLQRLDYLENDGDVVDDFGGDFEDDEYGEDDEYDF